MPESPLSELRLRSDDPALATLPYTLPLDAWTPTTAPLIETDLPASRHPVRIIETPLGRYAVKEMDTRLVEREWRILRLLADRAVPAVRPVGIALRVDGTGLLLTRFATATLTYRELFLRTSMRTDPYLERLLDALALLLVELHRAGVFWGDASLANTLLRRDGDEMVALLVDAETAEAHPALSDGQRSYDLDLAVEHVGMGLADIVIAKGRAEDADAMLELAHDLERRYRALYAELAVPVAVVAGDTHALVARISRLEALGYAVREASLAADGSGAVLFVDAGGRTYSRDRLLRLAGITAGEGQARRLLADLDAHRAWLATTRGSSVAEADAIAHWRLERLDPALTRLRTTLPARDPLQAFCDVLEHKWLLSQEAGRDIGLHAAIAAYLLAGAPAPESGPASPELAKMEREREIA